MTRDLPATLARARDQAGSLTDNGPNFRNLHETIPGLSCSDPKIVIIDGRTRRALVDMPEQEVTTSKGEWREGESFFRIQKTERAERVSAAFKMVNFNAHRGKLYLSQRQM